MLNKKERIMKAIVCELERQFDGGGISYYYRHNGETAYNPKEKNDFIEIEGRLDIDFVAESILEILR